MRVVRWVDWASGTIAALFLVVAGDRTAVGVARGGVHVVAHPGRRRRRAGQPGHRDHPRRRAVRPQHPPQRGGVGAVPRGPAGPADGPRGGARERPPPAAPLRRPSRVAGHRPAGTASPTGRLDPDAPDVQAKAALEERFIRTVIRVDPSIDAVHALATSLAVRARRRGVFLDVDLSGLACRRSADLTESRSSLMRAVECSLPGEVARLTARTEGESLVIRLVAPIARGSRDEMLQPGSAGGHGGPLDPDDPGMLWEVRQPLDARAMTAAGDPEVDARIRLALIDDHELVREGLRALIAAQDDDEVEIVYSGDSGRRRPSRAHPAWYCSTWTSAEGSDPVAVNTEDFTAAGIPVLLDQRVRRCRGRAIGTEVRCARLRPQAGVVRHAHRGAAHRQPRASCTCRWTSHRSSRRPTTRPT